MVIHNTLLGRVDTLEHRKFTGVYFVVVVVLYTSG